MGGELRVGFLGAGLIATYHSKSLKRSGAPVVRMGVYDPDVRRAEAFAEASGHTVMADEDEVLDSCDAVYVCTWTSEHLRQVEKAAARGLAIFCEKPLAFDVGAAVRMASMVNDAGIVNQVGLVLRRSPAYLWAKNLIDDTAAGTVMAVVFRDDQFIVIEGDDWYGPVSWTDADGDTGALGADELSAAVESLRDGWENPDGEFVRSVLAGTPATPDFTDAVKAHRIIDAMYASAAAGGTTVEVDRD